MTRLLVLLIGLVLIHQIQVIFQHLIVLQRLVQEVEGDLKGFASLGLILRDVQIYIVVLFGVQLIRRIQQVWYV